MDPTDAIEALGARLELLQARCDGLERDNADLRARLDASFAAPGATPESPDRGRQPPERWRSADRDHPAVSRRGLLGGAIATAAAAVALVERPEPAAAHSGDSVIAGGSTSGEGRTAVTYDGPAGFGGVILLGNDNTAYGGDSASYPAAIGGWAGAGSTAGAAKVASGVYGYTDNGSGNGVVGVNSNFVVGSGSGVLGTAASAGGCGVKGLNTLGTAVYGSSDSTAQSATAIIGVLTSTNPGSYSSAVRGQNNGTGGTGIGVWGSHAGSGWGGFFTSAGGIGVNVGGGTGTGVNASGATGVAALGDTVGVACSSAAGRGLVAAGNAAQIQLTPGLAATHPANGEAGDLYVDSSARLWMCQGGTSWLELTAPAPPGEFHVLASPVRVYDSRPASNGPAATGDGPLRAGAERTISLSSGYTGTVAAPAVPSGAIAAVLNLTVLNTGTSGSLTVFSAAVSWPGYPSLTWFQAKSDITSSVTSAVDSAASVKVHCKGAHAGTNFTIDVVGYYQ